MNNRRAVVYLTILAAVCLAAWSALAHEGEHHSPGGNGQPGNAPMTAQAFTPCVNGMAGTFQCNKVDLASFLPIADIDGTSAIDITANDIWGWTDSSTDKEYALLGLSNGVAFVDVTNPTAPVYLGNLPRTATAADSLWRSLKVYRNHLYTVSEAVGHGLQVFDLTQLRGVASPQTFNETAHYDNFSSAHTINVDEETGYLYVAGSKPNPGRTPNVDTCPGATATRGGGLHMINVSNPAAPAFAGCVNEDGYTHETQCIIYRGPDVQHQGREICFSSNEDTLTIIDVTNKSAPLQLSRTTYAGVGYTHQGWLTGDQRSFLINDELDERNSNPQNPGQSVLKTQTFIWDVSDLDAPFVRNIYQGPTFSIDHNLYVRGLHAFESNYRSGVRILDTSQAAAGNLSEVAFFDVYPVDDQSLFNGTWSNYPFFASGTIIASGIEQGLFVLRPQIGLPVKIDYEPFFVRQQYKDFLGREPDEPGLAFWTHEIDQCMGDAVCREVRRINVSAAFFLSIEHQNTGYLVERVYKTAFGDITEASTGLVIPIIRRGEFLTDSAIIRNGIIVGQGAWQAQLEANKNAYALSFVQRQRFTDAFPLSLTPAEFVDKLDLNAGGVLDATERTNLVNELTANNTNAGRASVLRKVAEDSDLDRHEKSRAFVLMQYFGYLQRNPDDAPQPGLNYSGWKFWLDKLESFNGNFVQAEMVKAFLDSTEYRQRFGQ